MDGTVSKMKGETVRREYPEQPVLAVAAVTFDPGNRLLLVRRAKEPAKGIWSIPGGVLELGESLAGALKREVLEETGIRVQPLHLIANVERILRDEEGRIRYHYVIAEYVCLGRSGIPIPSDDVDRAVWVSLDELSSYSLPEATIAVVREGWRLFQEGGGKTTLLDGNWQVQGGRTPGRGTAD